jgi:hypothetical protein
MINKHLENWGFLRMWPFKKETIREVRITILSSDEKYAGEFMLILDDSDYADVAYKEVHDTINDVVNKVIKWNKMEVDRIDYGEYQRLKCKFGGK